MPADPKPEDDKKKPDPKHQDELLDESLKETFPASDPVSITISTVSGRHKPPASN